jgi:hypothetical protein
MRTTVDLISELQSAASTAEAAGLLVLFENNAILIWAGHPDPLSFLNEAVEVGGHPVGLIRWLRHNGEVTFQVMPLEEFREDDYILDFIASLMLNFRRVLRGSRI